MKPRHPTARTKPDQGQILMRKYNRIHEAALALLRSLQRMEAEGAIRLPDIEYAAARKALEGVL